MGQRDEDRTHQCGKRSKSDFDEPTLSYYLNNGCQGDVNVICVDWSNGANLPNYVRAAVNTRLVGRQVAQLVNAINNAVGSNNSDFHLIGFSLGAHVAGFAGSELRNLSRITGEPTRRATAIALVSI